MKQSTSSVLALVALAASLLGCPPAAANVCDKLQSMRAADYSPPAREPCQERMDAMRSRSSGEYGMCSQCVMNALDRQALAACRERCPGFEDALPAK